MTQVESMVEDWTGQGYKKLVAVTMVPTVSQEAAALPFAYRRGDQKFP
jgi:hypothetical protein